MRRRFIPLFLVAAALTIAWPAASTATAPNNESNSYMFFMEVPNSAQNSAGDTLAVTGEGTWNVNRLIALQPYGCGVIFGLPLPPDLCGGRVVLDITAKTPFGPQSALLTIYCEIGSPPPSSEEGITAVVPSVGSFSRQTGGMNVYVKS